MGIALLPRKLRGRSVAELRERLAQQLSVARERLIDRGRAPTLSLTVARAASVRGVGLPDPDASVRCVRATAPAAEAAVMRRAERACAGDFELLGYESLSFGRPIDWHLDPIAGRRAPLRHWSLVPYLEPLVVGDHKVVWELNRHQYFVTLGQAYRYSGSERFADAFADHLSSWMDANPPKLGINWASSLEVGFRAISWVWGFHLFEGAAALTPQLRTRAVQHLEVHGRHLERYLSTYFSPNTHLTGEALALVYLGLALRELPRAERWLERGIAILEEWLPRQVRPDGVYFEQATQYHRYTTDFYTHLVVLAEANGLPLAPHVRPTLEKLHEFLLHVAQPDGHIPLIGDDDGGRLVQLDDRAPDDVRGTLAMGAALFGREDFAYVADGETAPLAWLLGEKGVRSLEALTPRPPSELSHAFLDGGYFVMRDGWGRDASQLVIDAGPHGVMNCGHAHADALAVTVVARGQPVLVDAGTYSYPGPERNAFRASAAHNTVTIDGRSSSEPSTPFQWASVANTEIHRWLSAPRFDFFDGSHDGYATLPDPVVHRRTVLNVRGDYWVIRDVVEAAGHHALVLRWLCAPGMHVVVEGPRAAIGPTAGQPAALTLFSAARGHFVRENGWVSPQYGRKLAAPALAVETASVGQGELVTLVVPAPVDGSTATVEELSSTHGRAFRVAVGRHSDLLLLGGGALVAERRVKTDASWLWLRSMREGTLREWFALDASYVEVDGRQLVPGGGTLPWCAGTTP
jgi:hypothetical protein